MAHTKSQKAAKGNRDSQSKRLGVKLYGGQDAKKGNVILRQRGTTYKVGKGSYMGKDYTIHAGIDGKVQYVIKKGKTHVNLISS